MSLTSSARTLLGKRFRHRGRGPVYFDCAGMVKETYRLEGLDLPDFRLYSTEPSAHGPGLTQYVQTALGDPVAMAPVREEQLLPEDVVILRFEHEPHHMGMLTPYPFGGLALIHACGHNKKVVEHRLSQDQINRITHVFRRPV